MASVLDGVRVLDLGAVIVGPLAGKLLADLGADVIKIERPSNGDQFRSYEAGFNATNFNKRSVCIDLTQKEGRDTLLELVERCDILIENFRPGVMDRMGLGYDVLHEKNPRLIYCAISGFGTSGPYHQRPAFDTAVTALSGFLSLMIDPAHPFVPGPAIADGVTGLFACYGILGALYERERTGRGRRIDLNMIECLAAFTNQAFGHFFETGVVHGPLTRASIAQAYVVRCRDGRMIGLHLSSPDKFWRGLLSALEDPEIAQDSRFASYDDRVKNYHLLSDLLMGAFAKHPSAEWYKRLERHEVPYAAVNNLDEAAEDPQFKALGTFAVLERQGRPPLKVVRRPVSYDGQRDVATRMPPSLGEHTTEVLQELDLGWKYDASAPASDKPTDAR